MGRHALDLLAGEGRAFDFFSLLRPTSPFRGADTIRRAWEQFIALDPPADSIRAVELCRQHPGKMWVMDGELMRPLLRAGAGEVPTHSRQYQALPEVYVQNSSLEIAWTRVAAEQARSPASASSRSSPTGARASRSTTRPTGEQAERDGPEPAPPPCAVAALMEAATVAAPRRSGTLRYVPLAELERLRALDARPASSARPPSPTPAGSTSLYMITRAGSGHIGTSFSSIDIVSLAAPRGARRRTTATSRRRATTPRRSTRC